VTSSKIEVNSPADMQGMLIRTPENPVIMATMRALGANPQPLAFSNCTWRSSRAPTTARRTRSRHLQQQALRGAEVPLRHPAHLLWNGVRHQRIHLAEDERLSAGDRRQGGQGQPGIQRETNKQMTEEFVSKLTDEGT
jgi:hypothetical protein